MIKHVLQIKHSTNIFHLHQLEINNNFCADAEIA